jgi:hypothetical protein
MAVTEKVVGARQLFGHARVVKFANAEYALVVFEALQFVRTRHSYGVLHSNPVRFAELTVVFAYSHVVVPVGRYRTV